MERTNDGSPQLLETGARSTVQLRLERMPLGQPGAAPHLSPMSMAVGESSMPARLFSHEVGVIFVANGAVVQTDQLDAMGLDEDGLLAQSVANLAALAPTLDMVRLPGMVMVTSAGGLEACMALVPTIWDDLLADEFPNGPVITMPAKDVLVACDRLDPAGIDGLLKAKQALLQQNPDALLAKELYERNADGAWTVFDQTAAIAAATAAAPASQAPADTPAHNPTMTIQEAGAEGIVIRDTDRDLGRGPRTDEQIHMLFTSGFRFNPTDQTWEKIFVGEQGSPFAPWMTPEWAATAPAKKRGFFGRRK